MLASNASQYHRYISISMVSNTFFSLYFFLCTRTIDVKKSRYIALESSFTGRDRLDSTFKIFYAYLSPWFFREAANESYFFSGPATTSWKDSSSGVLFYISLSQTVRMIVYF